jgi:hypothetical protein
MQQAECPAAARAAQSQAIMVAAAVDRALARQRGPAAKRAPSASTATALPVAAEPGSTPKAQQSADDGDELRVCQLCRRSKRLHSYGADDAQPDGLAARCRSAGRPLIAAPRVAQQGHFHQQLGLSILAHCRKCVEGAQLVIDDHDRCSCCTIVKHCAEFLTGSAICNVRAG